MGPRPIARSCGGRPNASATARSRARRAMSRCCRTRPSVRQRWSSARSATRRNRRGTSCAWGRRTPAATPSMCAPGSRSAETTFSESPALNGESHSPLVAWPAVASADENKRDELTLAEAARQAGVSPSTLRRWGEEGVIPATAAAGRARPPPTPASSRACASRVTRSRRSRRPARTDGSRSATWRSCSRRGASGYDLEQAAKDTGLEPALIERIWRALGFPAWMLDHLDDDDLEALRYMAAVLAAGFPLVAFLQVHARSTATRCARSRTPRRACSTSTCTSR